jgi:Ca2+-binding RTX toxin-like protein
LAPPPPTTPPNVTQIVTNINNAIAADRAANVPGTTPNPAPDNFAFTDLTVNVSGTTPGDAFKGAANVPDVKNQFTDLTPDNLLIRATAPNAFIESGSGNDVQIATSGHNILDGGSGQNVFIGGTGQNTYIQDITKDGGSALLMNPHSGDDLVFVGLDINAFSISLQSTPAGLEIRATAIAAADASRTADTLLSGFKPSDISKLTVGIHSGTGPDVGNNYAFVHFN